LVAAADVDFILLCLYEFASLHHFSVEDKKRAASERDQMLDFLQCDSDKAEKVSFLLHQLKHVKETIDSLAVELPVNACSDLRHGTLQGVGNRRINAVAGFRALVKFTFFNAVIVDTQTRRIIIDNAGRSIRRFFSGVLVGSQALERRPVSLKSVP